MRKYIPVILSLLTLAAGVSHQAHAQLYVGLNGGITLPQGFYADSRMSDHEWMFAQGHQLKAGAGRGWAAGIEISYAMPFHKSLEAVVCGEFMQSGASRDVQDYYQKVYARHYDQCSLYEMHLPRFRNIPLMAGLRYCFPLNTIFDLYGEAMAGMNIRTITDWTTAYADANWQQPEGEQSYEFNNLKIYRYTPATTFAFRLGAGILVKKKVSIGASFYMMGKAPLSWDQEETVRYNIAGEIKENTNTNHVDYFTINPTLVLVSIGFRLQAFSGARHVQDW